MFKDKVTKTKRFNFNSIVNTIIEGNEYMLGKGRSYVQQGGIKSSSNFENVQKYTPEQFNAGIKSVNRGSISEPPEVKATAKKISEAMLLASKDPILRKQIEDILTSYMTDYNELENFLREAGRMATAIESMQKALENAEGRKDLDKAAYYHNEIIDLTEKYEDKLADIEHIYDQLRKWIKKGPNVENQEKALALVQSLTPQSDIEQQILLQLVQAIQAYYGGTGNEANVMKIIYSLSPANTL